MDESCAVPGCPEPRAEYDCCTPHSRPDYGHCALFRPNDGVVDEIAIDLVAEGARQVPLTWVEAEIAAGTMLARGLSVTETMKRLGTQFKSRGRRREEIATIERALRYGGI